MAHGGEAEWVLLSPDRLFGQIPPTDLGTPVAAGPASPAAAAAEGGAAATAQPAVASSLPHALGGGDAGRILTVLDRCARARVPVCPGRAKRRNLNTKKLHTRMCAARQYRRDAA
jgi:hypothetical protein